jgi:hypothetical protein
MLHNQSIIDYVWSCHHVSNCEYDVCDHLGRQVVIVTRLSGKDDYAATWKTLAISLVDESTGVLKDKIVPVDLPFFDDYIV